MQADGWISTAAPIKKIEAAPTMAQWSDELAHRGRCRESVTGGLRVRARSSPVLLGEDIGKREAKRGSGRSRRPGWSQRTTRAPARVPKVSCCCRVRASSGRPWMMTVSMGTVIRACRPIIQSVE